jgi:hypothetical protein
VGGEQKAGDGFRFGRAHVPQLDFSWSDFSLAGTDILEILHWGPS